ncbi:hypothetical protein SDC9_195511 [bioreactor metagenome]|uniref:Uncharacterized protein n=1 Tax=bioreactor metagenome TaxID=1076179 RepID=A0A645I988_9ZZZZ
MVEEEIMQLVWANDVLRHLRNHAVLGWQQLRTDRCIDDVEQHFAQRGVGHARNVTQHGANQRFWHVRIDTVVGHMVAIIGGKPQCKLA